MALPQTVHSGTGIVGDRAEAPGHPPGNRGTPPSSPGMPCRSAVQKR